MLIGIVEMAGIEVFIGILELLGMVLVMGMVVLVDMVLIGIENSFETGVMVFFSILYILVKGTSWSVTVEALLQLHAPYLLASTTAFFNLCPATFIAIAPFYAAKPKYVFASWRTGLLCTTIFLVATESLSIRDGLSTIGTSTCSIDSPTFYKFPEESCVNFYLATSTSTCPTCRG